MSAKIRRACGFISLSFVFFWRNALVDWAERVKVRLDGVPPFRPVSLRATQQPSAYQCA